MTKYCRVEGCGVELTEDNWSPSDRKHGSRICKECQKKRLSSWREANPDKAKAQWTRENRKRGKLPMNENKDSPAFLGVYVNERLIRYRFKDVVVMPPNYPGYDFICNKNMKIDAKSACLGKNGNWVFHIGRNTEADFFLCVAYDNRNDLNIVHVWMIPGKDVNDHVSISISLSTIHKWDKYIYDIEGFSSCCNTMKNRGE